MMECKQFPYPDYTWLGPDKTGTLRDLIKASGRHN
jgi:hypothetical protein